MAEAQDYWVYRSRHDWNGTLRDRNLAVWLIRTSVTCNVRSQCIVGSSDWSQLQWLRSTR